MRVYLRVHIRGAVHRWDDFTGRPFPTVDSAGFGGTSPVVAVTTEAAPPASGKPAYSVPTMAQIKAMPLSGFTAASTFSGCGGSCLGQRMAGFDVRWASEFVPAAADTYRANHPGVHLDTRDLREVTPEMILADLGMAAGDLDLLDGSPPCASFSSAGKRNAHWGEVKAYSDTKQRTDDLFFEYARILKGLQPRVFIAENVPGLVRGVAKGYFKEILAALKGAGYRVEARKLDASWLGVPQARQRVFFVGVRDDLGLGPAWPAPLPYRYTVRDALPWIFAQGDNGGFGGGGMRPADAPSPAIGAGPSTGNGRFPPSRVAVVHERGLSWPSGGNVSDKPVPAVTIGVGSLNSQHYQVRVVHDTDGQFSNGDETDRPAFTMAAGDSQSGKARSRTHRVIGDGTVTHDPETGEDITLGRYAIGAKWQRLQAGERTGGYGPPPHPSAEEAYPTVRANAEGGLIGSSYGAHWAECRKLTLDELRALCGFPADFVLTGTYAQRWERLGRAVPPPMMFRLAAAIRDQVLIPLREQGRI